MLNIFVMCIIYYCRRPLCSKMFYF